jgi:hypothetical protein
VDILEPRSTVDDVQPQLARSARWGWRLPSLAAAGCAWVAVPAAIAGLSAVKLPWMVELTTGALSHLRVQRLLAVFALVAGYSLAKAFFLRRAGLVSFSPEGVVFRGKHFLAQTVPWSQLDRYSDSSPVAVDLLRQGETWPRAALAIPTPDEPSRTAVLRELDAHGLARVEIAAHGTGALRAALVAALVVSLLFAADFAATSRYRTICALWDGTLSKDEASAVLPEFVTVRHLVRPVIGTEDALYVEEHHAWLGEPSPGLDAPLVTESFSYSGPVLVKWPDPIVDYRFLETTSTTDLEVDGRAVPGDAWTLNTLDDRYVPWSSYAPASRAHGLAPGRHELRWITHFDCKHGTFAKEDRRTIEVVPGSVASTAVQLARGPEPKLTLDLRDSPGHCWVSYRSGLAHPLYARVEVSDGERRLAEARLLAPASWPTGQQLRDASGKEYELPSLSPGHHVFTFRFLPDARVAFENDAQAGEIVGEPCERQVVVDVP